MSTDSRIRTVCNAHPPKTKSGQLKVLRLNDAYTRCVVVLVCSQFFSMGIEDATRVSSGPSAGRRVCGGSP